MILVCSQCSSRLQLEDAKVPARPFTVRCPKCQSIIQGQPAVSSNEQQSGLNVGETPSLDNARFTPPVPAPAFRANRVEEVEDNSKTAAKDPNDLARLLAELLQQSVPGAAKQENAARLKWANRRALVCVTPARREAIARALVDGDYQVYVAEDTSQAIERMREAQMDVVILESEFDQIEQGAAFVTSEINALHPAKRRRLMFVQLSPTVRTLDTHAAFVNNVNLVVNAGDVDHLPQALERAIRDFNDLYRDFNTALNLASI